MSFYAAEIAPYGFCENDDKMSYSLPPVNTENSLNHVATHRKFVIRKSTIFCETNFKIGHSMP